MKRREKDRAAFTLIEILVSVVIIALLTALLLPAISAARRNAVVAQVTAEISGIEDSLEVFKTEFREYPPSQITLHGSLTKWDSDPKSKALVRRLWPKFDFTSDGAGGKFIGDTSVTLDGAECLLFFLGGVRSGDGVFVGFSPNSARPFSLDPVGSRVGPFLDIRDIGTSRLVDIDGDSLFEYLDPISEQTNPYIYLSSYNGKGYDAADLGGRMTDFYKQNSSTGWNAKSFQIISPGFDGAYGVGGVYDPETANNDLIGPREAERDNIANFSSGTLAD